MWSPDPYFCLSKDMARDVAQQSQIWPARFQESGTGFSCGCGHVGCGLGSGCEGACTEPAENGAVLVLVGVDADEAVVFELASDVLDGLDGDARLICDSGVERVGLKVGDTVEDVEDE